jgi:hypothetical protein
VSEGASAGTSRWDTLRCDRAAAVVALAAVLLHLLTAGGYGIFRDELYYLACAEHLDWGYVDHPPLVALVAYVVQSVLGTSLFAVRLVPALAAGATIYLAAAIARQLGGGRFAQLLTAVAVALTPLYLGLLSIYSMNAIDLVVWSALLLVLVRILRTDDRRLWLLFGAIAGVGLQNKLSVLFLGFGVAAGLLAARQWRHLRDWRLWLGAAIAALLFAPHILWQAASDWPTAEFVRRATEHKNVAFAPHQFIAQQIMLINPVTLPLWLAGLGHLLLADDGRRFRAVGWAYLAVLVLMTTQNAKPYYLGPIYPVLLAAGAVVVERAARGRMAWLRAASVAAVVVSGAIAAPLAKPLLPVETYVEYAAVIGVAPGSDERHRLGRLPQFFADMHGWQELAEAVARVHRTLPPEERARACVFAQNYGQAGAIDFFGPRLGLPRAVSGHNSYWLWGPRGCDGSTVIIIGGDPADHRRVFADVTEAGRTHCRDCMPYESDLALWVAREPRLLLSAIWQRVKHFD